MNKIEKKIVCDFQNLGDCDFWDKFVDNSINGTIFHKRSFLSYHGNKFDLGLLSFSLDNKIIAGIVFHIDNNKLISPKGASYGGIVFLAVPLNVMNSVFIEFINWSKKNNVKSILITTAPTVYSNSLSQDVDFLYLYHGFNLFETKFSSVIDLRTFGNDVAKSYSNMGQRAIKKILQK